MMSRILHIRLWNEVFCLWCVHVVFVIPHALAQEPGPQTPPAAEEPAGEQPAGRPRIEIEPKVLDIGEVFIGENGEGKIKIMNTGTAPLVLSKIKSSCGCTVAQLAQEDRTIAPGGSVLLPVTMKPSKIKRGDRFVKNLSIHSNDPIQPVLPVQVECRVQVGVDADPYSLVFKKVLPGETRTQELILRSYTEEEFEILGVDPIPGPIQVDFEKGKRAREHTVQVTIGPMPDNNNLHSRLRFQTSHGKTPHTEVMLLIQVEKLIQVIPTYLNLGQHAPGSLVEKRISLEPKGDRKIESVQVEVSRYEMDVTARPADDDPGAWILAFNVPDNLSGKKLISPLVITTNIKEAGTLKITMSMSVSGVPEKLKG